MVALEKLACWAVQGLFCMTGRALSAVYALILYVERACHILSFVWSAVKLLVYWAIQVLFFMTGRDFSTTCAVVICTFCVGAVCIYGVLRRFNLPEGSCEDDTMSNKRELLDSGSDAEPDSRRPFNSGSDVGHGSRRASNSGSGVKPDSRRPSNSGSDVKPVSPQPSDSGSGAKPGGDQPSSSTSNTYGPTQRLRGQSQAAGHDHQQDVNIDTHGKPQEVQLYCRVCTNRTLPWDINDEHDIPMLDGPRGDIMCNKGDRPLFKAVNSKCNKCGNRYLCNPKGAICGECFAIMTDFRLTRPKCNNTDGSAPRFFAKGSVPAGMKNPAQNGECKYARICNTCHNYNWDNGGKPQCGCGTFTRATVGRLYSSKGRTTVTGFILLE